MQETGKGESAVSLLVNGHDDVKLQSYGLESWCNINCCILFPVRTKTHPHATGSPESYLGVIPNPPWRETEREEWKGGE